MITSPFCLYDCDVPVDGSTALIVSAAEHARNVDHGAPTVEAVGTGLVGRPSWDQWADLTTMAAVDAAASMWARTDLKPADVDVAELYDGFSWLSMCWLEALGFCGHGESGPFIAGGGRIALEGELPLNTNGGQLSSGRLHGFGFLHEACVQLRGEGGDRQVPKAVDVAVVANGGGPIAGCLLLTQ
jgi:acetyl-CoA acetyltransferase